MTESQNSDLLLSYDQNKIVGIIFATTIEFFIEIF